MRFQRTARPAAAAEASRAAAADRATARRTGPGGRRSAALNEPHPPPLALAAGAVADQFDPGPVDGVDHLLQAVDHRLDDAVAGFHALDRGDRHPRQPGELLL